jgi:hypothetical protein
MAFGTSNVGKGSKPSAGSKAYLQDYYRQMSQPVNVPNLGLIQSLPQEYLNAYTTARVDETRGGYGSPQLAPQRATDEIVYGARLANAGVASIDTLTGLFQAQGKSLPEASALAQQQYAKQVQMHGPESGWGRIAAAAGGAHPMHKWSDQPGSYQTQDPATGQAIFRDPGLPPASVYSPSHGTWGQPMNPAAAPTDAAPGYWLGGVSPGTPHQGWQGPLPPNFGANVGGNPFAVPNPNAQAGANTGLTGLGKLADFFKAGGG